MNTYLAVMAWRLENMSAAEHRTADEVAGRLAAGLLRRARRLRTTRTVRPEPVVFSVPSPPVV